MALAQAIRRLTSVSADGTLQAGRLTKVDASASARTMTLPDPAILEIGAALSVRKNDSSTNIVTVTGLIDGATNSYQLVSQRHSIELLSDGVTWTIHDERVPLASVITTADARVLAGTASAGRSGAYADLTGKPSIPSTPGAVGAEPAGLSAGTLASLNNTYVKFTDVNGNPLPPGHVVQIRLTSDLTDIDNIVAVAQ